MADMGLIRNKLIITSPLLGLPDIERSQARTLQMVYAREDELHLPVGLCVILIQTYMNQQCRSRRCF